MIFTAITADFKGICKFASRMATFRSNHRRPGTRRKGGLIIQLGFLALLLLGLILLGRNIPALMELFEPHTEHPLIQGDARFYLPSCPNGSLKHLKYVSICYDEETDNIRWLAYELYADWLMEPSELRGAALKDELLEHSQWPGVSAGFRSGVWREMEELTYDWVRNAKHLYIATGPIYTDSMQISAVYKVLLDLHEPEVKGIGFVIPNNETDTRIEMFACSIRAVEELTRIDFFHELMLDSLANSVETEFDISRWEINEQRYQKRIKVWNQ